MRGLSATTYLIVAAKPFLLHCAVMNVDDPEQKPNAEKATDSGILNGAMDMLSAVELLSYAVVGLFRIAGFVLGGLARLLP